MAQGRGDGHRSLVTPERVLSEHNEDLIFLYDEVKTRLCVRNFKLGDIFVSYVHVKVFSHSMLQ